MQPTKIIIPGEYWDSQIFSGRLFLFGVNGNILTLDWNRLIDEINISRDLRLPLQVAFQQSGLFYGSEYRRRFRNAEEKSAILEKFVRLSRKEFSVSKGKMNALLIGQQENRFPFPHSDSLIYKGNLYMSSKSGIFRGSCFKKKKNPVSSRPARKWDGPVLAMSASQKKLAFAAGSDGLFVMDLKPKYRLIARIIPTQPERIFQSRCIDCHWTFESIFCSSNIESGYLVEYTKYIEDKSFNRSSHLVEAKSIFQGDGYSWGAQDKLCQARDGVIHMVRYNPMSDNAKFVPLGTLKAPLWKGNVVSGKIAYWGVIVEFDDNIVIFPSEGKPIIFQGEPVSWRIFHQSKRYANQMHIIYEDRIEIISFNHDYFVDQKRKIAGIEYV